MTRTAAPARPVRAEKNGRQLRPVPSRPMLLAVLEHLVAHGDRERAAEDLSQPYSVVMQVAAAHGWPSVERMNADLRRLQQIDAASAPCSQLVDGAEPQPTSPLEDLVRAAATSRRPSTRRALRGLLVAGRRLREAVDADRDVTAEARDLPAAG